MKTFLRRCLHVIGGSRTFNSVPDYDGWVIIRIGLPATMSEDFNPRLHFKQTLLILFGSKAKSPWPRICSDSLRMPVLEYWMRPEDFVAEGLPYAREESLGLLQLGISFVELEFIAH